MIDDLETLLKSAVDEVFGKMLNLTVQTVPLEGESVAEGMQVAGSVGFIGHLTGVVYIYASADLARNLTSTLLGMPIDEVDGDEMVNDSMGELANMIVGTVKGTLSERGLSCVLTIPSIVRGSQFCIEAVSTATRRVLGFQAGNQGRFVVELMIKPPEPND